MNDVNSNPYFKLFLKQRENQYAVGNRSYKERRKILTQLQRAIEVTYRTQIQEALQKDLGKPVVETELTEIFAIIGDIKHAKKHLKQWTQKQRVETPMSMLGSSSYITYEPKGVCLIISPWNFPFNLTFGPLVSAIAAGNTAIIKPSEMTPHSSALMSKIIADVFLEDEVALVQGEVEVSTQLLKLPFNHIFFTGSPNVGKIVMEAASKHLASVTLELGGKSPTIVDKTANIDKAAKKIMWAKFLNCGQICVAPDYILIDESIKTQFITSCKKWLKSYYNDYPKTSDSYGKIVTDKHFERLNSYLENARALKATFEVGGETDSASKYIEPTLISDLKPEAKLLEDEIFGPILPIVTYENLDEAIKYINSKPRPLALYIYSKSKVNTRKIMNNTRAGGTCINNSVLHYANHNLPFGGVNNSGIGKSHGFFGFKAFSNERSVMKQHTFGVTELLFPPYSSFKEKLARWTIKWF
ncbi:aldehyde dehydrogenase family protein [Winogradskyella psychrotolerans]|uniref:aldehyde dehydrogenase family protein n=1 Tax=Winogradskyella psychrotolerans TaxID=1344585 RepID=UPI001C073541|nr:aldehyde dehydrogenase family protein [Winogradskyella psychrotolerans]MBU2922486.1 aldehyde dehydrogenase family protein [Winogradskyella psychrotolerans]